jgi:hypothetical protein
MYARHKRAVIVLVCALILWSGCGAKASLDEGRDTLLAGLRRTAAALGAAATALHETFVVQRDRLAGNVQQAASVTIASLLGVADHLYGAVEIVGVQITRLRETLTASARVSLATVGARASQLHNRVQAAAVDVIGSLTGEIVRPRAVTLG